MSGAPKTADPKPFGERLTREPLRWTQPRRWHRGWELWSGDRVIATLAPSSTIVLKLFRSTRLVATSPGGEWECLTRWRGSELRRPGQAEPVIEFRGTWSLFKYRGRVTVGADELEWRTGVHLFRRTSFELLSASEFPLVQVEPRGAGLRLEGTITITDTGRRHGQIEALTMFA